MTTLFQKEVGRRQSFVWENIVFVRDGKSEEKDGRRAAVPPK
jgi:hypothetical protein